MDSSPGEILRFGVFELDTRTGELRKAGSRVRLQQKPTQLLLLLLERPGDLVSRDELRERLWPADTFVDFDHSLATAVAKLRWAIGDSARTPRFVETIGGRGYRFLAPVTRGARMSLAPTPAAPTVSPDPPDPPAPPVGVGDAPANDVPAVWSSTPRTVRLRRLLWVVGSVTVGLGVGGLALAMTLWTDVGGVRAWLRRQTTAPVHSLAVLPLQNVSVDASQEYVADGTTEQLINVLARLPGVRVISRTSAMRYKGSTRPLPQIGRELGADAIVEGSVAYAGGRVRVSVQLIDVRTDQHLWAQSYERDAADILILQQDVAASIADEIRLQLSSNDRANLTRSRTVVPAAHDAYLRARYHLNKGAAEDLMRSIDDFNEAIRFDPSDAASYAGLAQAYIALTDFYERPTVMMPKARAAAEQALTLDNRSAEAHMAFGAVRFLYDWNWTEAESEMKRALALNAASADAHVWYAIFLAQMGRFDPAFAEISRASALDPLSVPVHINAGWIYYLARQNDRAVAEWKKALDLEPTLGVVHTSIWLAYAQDGRPIDLKAIGADAGDESPLNMATVAGAYAMSGKRSEAEAVISRLHALAQHRYVCSYEIATTHAALHQDDEAFRWLRRGLEDRSSCMPDLKVDPRFERLRHDPRFLQLLREVGFAS